MDLSSMLDIVAKVLQIASVLWGVIFGSKAVIEIVRRKKNPSGTVPPPPPGTVSPPPPRTIFGAKRSTLLNVGLAIVVLVVSFLITSLLPTSVLITAPTNGDKVPIQTTVQGTVHNIPKDEELWVLIVPDGVTGYYPQSGPVVVTGNTWSSSARVGLASDSGLGFTLIAALADQKSSTAIRAYLDQSGSDFRGLDPLPPGIQLMNQVHVTRMSFVS